MSLGEKGTSFPNGSTADTSAWTRVSCEVPAAWKGRRVVFSVPWGLNKCDLVLHVNGERAGDVLRPAGRLDVTEKVRFGAPNEFVKCSGSDLGTQHQTQEMMGHRPHRAAPSREGEEPRTARPRGPDGD